MDERNAAYWKERLQLLEHVEGGAYRRTYCSSLLVSKNILPSAFKGDRALSSAIYFLLEYGQFSAFHRIQSDEMWHFYSGSTLHIYEITTVGKLVTHLLGNDPEKGEQLQVVITAGSWFGSRVEEPGKFALVGCTVTPAFDFEDFELAERSELQSEYPEYKELIGSLTR